MYSVHRGKNTYDKKCIKALVCSGAQDKNNKIYVWE